MKVRGSAPRQALRAHKFSRAHGDTPGPRSGRFSGIEFGGTALGDGRSVAGHGGPQRFVVKPRAATLENRDVRDT